MTLLYIDGFDNGDFGNRWTGINTGIAASSTTPWGVGKSLSMPNQANSRTIKRSVAASSHIFVGMNYLRPTNAQAGQSLICALQGDAGATTHLVISLGSAILAPGAIQVFRSSTVTDSISSGAIAQSANNVVPFDQWHYIEVEATISDTVGICNVYVDGVQVIAFSGDTKNAGTNSTIDTVALGVFTTNHNGPFQIDDLYIANDQGSRNNTLLGPVRAYTLNPNAAGNDSGLTPTGSANHYANVSDQSTATWNASSVATTRDTYALPDLPSDATTVFGTQLVISTQNSDAGAGSMKPVYRSGGTNFYDTTIVGSASVVTTVDAVRETDPATSTTWTVSGVNALQIGAEVV